MKTKSQTFIFSKDMVNIEDCTFFDSYVIYEQNMFTYFGVITLCKPSMPYSSDCNIDTQKFIIFDPDTIKNIYNETSTDSYYLTVWWVPEGAKFFIDYVDNIEEIVFYDDMKSYDNNINWITLNQIALG